MMSRSKFYKILASQVRPFESRVAAICKVTKTAFNEMVDRQLGDCTIVCVGPGYTRDMPSGAQVDDWSLVPAYRFGDRVGFDSSDNPVAFPSG
jgi:hypothetical protein